MIYKKIRAVTGCLEHVAWALYDYDCELPGALPPWLSEMSERWAIRWSFVNRWLDGTLEDYWLEMQEEDRKASATIETIERNQLFAPA